MGRRHDEDGYTLTEVLVSLVILSIFMALAASIIINVTEESAAQRETAIGAEQAQLADHTFSQYLRGAISVNYIASSGDDIVFSAYVGTSVGSDGVTVNPGTETIEAILCGTANAKVDSIEFISGIPSSDPTGVHQCLSSGAVTLNPPSPLPKVPSGLRVIQAFYILAPSSPIFTFYDATNSSVTSGTGTLVQPALASLSITDAQAEETSLDAIGMTATFEPSPTAAAGGFRAEQATTIHTVAFIRDREVDHR